MKKILGIVPYTFLPAVTGGQKAIASLYQTLSSAFDVICVGTKRNDSLTVNTYKVITFFSSSPLRYINLFNFLKLRSLIKKERSEFLMMEHPYLGWLGILLQKTTGVKLVIHSHNIEGLRFKHLGKWWWKILLMYEGWVHRQADVSFFITEEDRTYAIKKFKVNERKAHVITFGIPQVEKPEPEERTEAKQQLLSDHKLAAGTIILLFNGAFDYAPNANALHHLVTEIFPLLNNTEKFKLIVCGKHIPNETIENSTDPNIIFAGFVPDIDVYLKGADIFVNPITEGGGIKTKLVEALAFNLNCVSYASGAIGVSPGICGDKLLVVEDKNANQFATAIKLATEVTSNIPEAFFDHFSNQKIREKIKGIL